MPVDQQALASTLQSLLKTVDLPTTTGDEALVGGDENGGEDVLEGGESGVDENHGNS